MINKDYWHERMLAVENMAHEKSAKYLANIDKQFRLAERNMQRDIEQWYQRLADNNEISLAKAKEMLRKDELQDFHMTVEEYIKKGEQLDFDSRFMRQLENASTKVHISRLEALKLQLQQECEVLYGGMSDELSDMLTDVYTSSYYNTVFDLFQGCGVGWAFNILDTRRIEQAINTAWTYDNKTFSDRVWSNKAKLNNELNTILTQSIIRGEEPRKTIEQLSKRMKTSRYNAGRLIMTESSAIYSRSQKDAFRELDVELYEFVATLDSHTSDICRHMDGKIFKMSDYVVGETAPPLHCFCRSVVVPYYEDDFGVVGERIARDKDGNTYNVPANMNYEQWYKTYVPKDLKQKSKNGIIKGGNKNIAELVQTLPDYKKVKTKLNRKEYAENVIDTLGIDRSGVNVEVKALNDNGACFVSADCTDTCHYNSYVLKSTDKRSDLHKIKTVFHEAFHYSLQGKKWDAIKGNQLSHKWLSIEETFAECSAHYVTDLLGIKKLTPSYSGKLIRVLPRLKQLDKYKSCKSISDFGEIAWADRLSGQGGVWGSLYDEVFSKSLTDDYYMAYIDYIENNKDKVFDSIMEQMAEYTDYKDSIRMDLDSSMDKLKGGKWSIDELDGNEKMIGEMALATSMQQKGVI